MQKVVQDLKNHNLKEENQEKFPQGFFWKSLLCSR